MSRGSNIPPLFSVPSRRQFLTGLATLSASALVPRPGPSAQTQTAKKRPRRIDVHHHPTAPQSISGIGRDGPPPPPAFQTGPLPSVWTPANAIEEMDQGGVDLTILSSPQGMLDDKDAARRRSRSYNDYMAKLVSDYPGRFGMWTALPVPDVDGTLKEIEYGLDVLKSDGVSMVTNYGDKWLGDPMFAPIFEELNRRKVVVYTHPVAPSCCGGVLVPGIGQTTIELGTDTTRAITRMVFTGTSAKYPDMRMIFSHAGGTMPYLVMRMLKDSLGVPNGFLPEAGRFYYDTAQAAGAAPMAALKHVIPVSHIVFGTDFPWLTAKDQAKGLKDCGVFTAAELAQIDSGNMLALLPKYS